MTAYQHTRGYDMSTALLLREFANASVASVILRGCLLAGSAIHRER